MRYNGFLNTRFRYAEQPRRLRFFMTQSIHILKGGTRARARTDTQTNTHKHAQAQQFRLELSLHLMITGLRANAVATGFSTGLWEIWRKRGLSLGIANASQPDRRPICPIVHTHSNNQNT